MRAVEGLINYSSRHACVEALRSFDYKTRSLIEGAVYVPVYRASRMGIEDPLDLSIYIPIRNGIKRGHDGE